MKLPSLAQIEEAQAVIYESMPPTPQYNWPLLSERLQTEAWVKHENHTPVGAFKLRGALVYLNWIRKAQPQLQGVVAATRGNHGQGVALAAKRLGLAAVIVVPHGNSREKNRVMRAQGVELIEYGEDFQASLEYARTVADERGYILVDSFHELLIRGTATYAIEFLRAAPPLDAVYVPIGLGSSICGIVAARNALGLKTEIVGVVAEASPSYAESFRRRSVIEAPARTQIADGLACRTPNADALEVIWNNVARIVEVSDDAIEEAMRIYFSDTHNVAEGAAAAPLAGAMKEAPRYSGGRIGLVFTGGNVDRSVFARVLNDGGMA
jgi:threonine dehydratase